MGRVLLASFLLVAVCPARAQDAGRVEELIADVCRAGLLSRKEVEDGSHTLGPPTVESITLLLSHPQKSVRILAALDLLELSDPAASPALIAATHDPDVDVRRVAIRCVGLLAVATPEGLLESLGDPETSVRRAAVQGLLDLHRTRPAGLARVLAEALRAHENVAARSGAARVLHILGPAAAPATADLVGSLSHGRSEVRAAAARVLVAIGAKAVPLIVGTLMDRASNARASAAATLGRMGPAALPEAGLALVWAAHDPEPGVRFAARKALRSLGSASVPKPLRPSWSELPVMGKVTPAIPGGWIVLEGGEKQRVAAALELTSRDALAEALKDTFPRVRQAAVWALEEIGPDARAERVEILDDGNQEVRVQAIRAMGRLGPESAAALGEAATHERARHPGRATRKLILEILRLYGPYAEPAAADVVRALAMSPEARPRPDPGSEV